MSRRRRTTRLAASFQWARWGVGGTAGFWKHRAAPEQRPVPDAGMWHWRRADVVILSTLCSCFARGWYCDWHVAAVKAPLPAEAPQPPCSAGHCWPATRTRRPAFCLIRARERGNPRQTLDMAHTNNTALHCLFARAPFASCWPPSTKLETARNRQRCSSVRCTLRQTATDHELVFPVYTTLPCLATTPAIGSRAPAASMVAAVLFLRTHIAEPAGM